MVEAVEAIHKCGFVHKDIKPDNFRIHDHQVLMIDFGLTMSIDKDGIHLPRERYGFEGTLFFASIRAL
jgi:serine/threonine protein kinase